jgi:hypothetical protein
VCEEVVGGGLGLRESFDGEAVEEGEECGRDLLECELQTLVVGHAFGDAADDGAQPRVPLGELGGRLRFSYGLVPEVDEEEVGLSLVLEHRDELAGGRDWLMSVYTPKDWLTLRDGTDVVIDRHFDPIDGVNIVTHRWRDLDGQRHERQHRLRAYTATEINQMLRRAHLRPTAWYGGFSLEPFDRTSRRLLVIAERSETSAD